jgi:hypothetical protein
VETRVASRLSVDAARVANSCNSRLLSGARDLIKVSLEERKCLISMAEGQLEDIAGAAEQFDRTMKGLRELSA